MTDQKGFLVYRDIEDTLDAMTDEQAGQLFKGMVRYFNHGEDPQLDGPLRFAFIPIRQQMDRDVERYADKCSKNRDNIKKYWDKVKDGTDTNVYDRIRTYTTATNKNTNTNTNTNTNKNKNTNTNKNTTTNTNTNTNNNVVVVSDDDGVSYTDIWRSLSPEDVEALYEAYPESAGDLIQTVHDDVKAKRKKIKRPASYVLGYAERVGWVDTAVNGGIE